MDSVSRLSSILGTTHGLTLDAARDALTARRPYADTPARIAQIKKLLDSRNEREILDGLRKVISISHRPPAPRDPLLFSAVLKNIASPSPHVKKLVYIHLLQYAEGDPDTALLAINTIQKTLSHADPQLRALALRVMSSIRVPVISQIVLLAIKKGCGDMSPLVRKAAALAVPKCIRLDPATSNQCEEFLAQLLGDRQYFVVGAAAVAFMDVCGWDRIDLVHAHYSGLTRKLVDMDEWGQVATLRLLTGYARKCFPQKWEAEEQASADFYDESKQATGALKPVIDDDLELLFKAAAPLLQSRNPAVVVAVARLYACCAPAPPHSNHLLAAVGPLVALLRGPPDTHAVVLHNIIQVALILPTPFARYSHHFLLRNSDSSATRRLKLEVQTIVFAHAPTQTQSLILAELAHLCQNPGTADSTLVRDCVRAIGRCAQAADASQAPEASATASRCLALLLDQVARGNGATSTSPQPALVGEALTVIRHLVQADPQRLARPVVTLLAKRLDTLDSLDDTHARASIIWMVGEYLAGHEDSVAPDVLRILSKGFAGEAEPAKLQVVLLAAKVYVHFLNSRGGAENDAVPAATSDYSAVGNENGEAATNKSTEQHPVPALFHYILLLARYDVSYDLRDRARLYKALLAVPASTQLASLLLLAPKPVPAVPSPSESRKGFLLGSASLVVGVDEAGVRGLNGYTALPDWVKPGAEPDARLRADGDAGAAASVYGSPSKAAMVSASDRLDAGLAASGRPRGLPAGNKTLDDWLAESSGEEEEDDEDEDEEEEDDDGSAESDDDEASDEDDDDDQEDGETSSEDEQGAGANAERRDLLKK